LLGIVIRDGRRRSPYTPRRNNRTGMPLLEVSFDLAFYCLDGANIACQSGLQVE
jgi:hypothetical protein